MSIAKNALGFAAALLISQLSACGGNDGPVEYNGGTLVLDGKPYRKEAGDTVFAPGCVIVAWKDDQEGLLRNELARLGLTVIREKSDRALLVAVREGYESQWATALSTQAMVKYTANEDPIQTCR